MPKLKFQSYNFEDELRVSIFRVGLGACLHLSVGICSSTLTSRRLPSVFRFALPPVILSIAMPETAQSPQTAADASAAPPGQANLPLSMLNKASVKTGGKWDVYIWRPFEDKYEYNWQGKPRQGSNFTCTLVSADDPRHYCQARLKKTSQNGAKYQQALNAYTHGARFVMSKVGFVEDAKAAYVSCPLKLVVDLSNTRMDSCIGAADSAVQPAPTATVAASINLGTNQFFDVTALIQEVQETRQHENNRSSFVVRIHDGSLDDDTQEVKAMPLRMYFDTARTDTHSRSAEHLASGEKLKAFVEEHLHSKTAVSFFCISGAQDDNGKFSFRTTKNTILDKGVGTKAENLNSNAVLHSLQLEDTVAFELQTATATRDWSKELGKETRCKLLASFARNATGVPEIDETETIWQLNWVEVTEPSQGQSIRNNHGTRLWFPVTLRDHSGPIVLYITERAALKLANAVDAAEFEQLLSENRLRFPFWASVKVWRRRSKPRVAESGSNETETQQRQSSDFDCFVVDASEQDMHEAPSLNSAMLLPMLSNSVDNVLPATLAMIKRSDHYAMAVEYITQEPPPELAKKIPKVVVGVPILRPCSRVVALVLSTSRSKVLDAGAGGHKLVTDNVVDYFPAGSDAIQKTYSLTSFCTLDTVTDFKLDPPGRTKSQAALISVSGMLGPDTDSVEQPVAMLLVENVQLLTPPEAEALKPIFSKMFYFAALAGQVSRKRENEPWSPGENPAKASACRVLSRSPTGPALPEYSSKSAP